MTQAGRQAPYQDGIPVVQNSTDRALRFPNPVTDQRVHNLTSGAIERWTAGGWSADLIAPRVFDVKVYGATGDGTTDDTAAIQEAVNSATNGATIYFPRASSNYLVAGTITIAKKGLTFLLSGGIDQAGINSTSLNPIQLGTDDGLNWDDPNYNGTGSGFAFVGGSLNYTGTASALSNGLGNYGVNGKAIVDWRGGSIRIENASLQGWDYWFWGVQSDINVFRNLIVTKNERGCFLGARSDQARFDHIWTGHNGTVFTFEGSKGHQVSHWITDSDGSATRNPVVVHNSTPSISARYATTRATSNIVFDSPWCESLAGGSSSFDVEAFFDLNVGDVVVGGAVTIRDPIVFVNLYNTPAVQHTLYLVKCDALTTVKVDGLTAAPGVIPWNNLRSVFKVMSGAGNPPYIWFRDDDQLGNSATRLIENYSAIGLTVAGIHAGSLTNYGTNVVGGTGGVNQAWLGLQHSIYHNNTPPSAGNSGDVQFNRVFDKGKSLGWAKTTALSTVVHAPTLGNARGDADFTLTPETDDEEQQVTSALTADRICTLAAPPNATLGNTFCLTRTTGAFNLNVHNLTAGGTLLKAMPASSWAVFIYDGTNWSLRRYGLL